MEANYNPYSFMSNDIVAWNGILTSFGAIAHLTADGDSLRMANEEEERNYQNAPHSL